MYKHNNRYIKKRNKRPAYVVMAIMVFGAGMLIATAKSILSFPMVQGVSNFEAAEAERADIKITWPKYGQSALGAQGYGVLEASSNKEAQPTASVAKVMTALAILEKHPLQPGEQGPSISITKTDEELFSEYWAKNGTSVSLPAGSEISEYRALQYILIPSANNVADTAVVWAFGSMEEYTKYANDLAKRLGMENSNFADASGFSPKTTSTASDLIKLGEKAMQNPVFAEIVKTWEVELPDGNKAQNSNVFLDYNGNGVIGIKTGDTDQAGGVYMTAAEHEVDGQTIQIITVVMGGKTLTDAQKDAMKIIESSKKGFSTQKVVSSGQIVGSYQVPWQGSIDAVSSQDIYAISWASKPVRVEAKLLDIGQTLATGDIVGEIVVDVGHNRVSQPVNLVANIEPPPAAWVIRKYL